MVTYRRFVVFFFSFHSLPFNSIVTLIHCRMYYKLLCVLFFIGTTSATISFACDGVKFSFPVTYELLQYGTMGGKLNSFNGSLIATDPVTACSSIQNDVAGKLVVTQSGMASHLKKLTFVGSINPSLYGTNCCVGGCDPTVKARNIQQAGGLIAINVEAASTTRLAGMPWHAPDVIIPVYDAYANQYFARLFAIIQKTDKNQLNCSSAGVAGT